MNRSYVTPYFFSGDIAPGSAHEDKRKKGTLFYIKLNNEDVMINSCLFGGTWSHIQSLQTPTIYFTGLMLIIRDGLSFYS